MTLTEKLAALDTLQVGEQTYLPEAVAVETAAAFLYPNTGGPNNVEEYNALWQKLNASLRQLGYGTETHDLVPPAVPFNKRGGYFKKLPAISSEKVAELLPTATYTDSTKPMERLSTDTLASNAANEIFGSPLPQLDEDTQQALKQVCYEVAVAQGFEKDKHFHGYHRPLRPNLEEARKCADELIKESIDMIWQVNLRRDTQIGAYGRTFDARSPLVPELETIIKETLTANNYETDVHVDGYFHPQPLPLPDDFDNKLQEKLDGFAQHPVYTSAGKIVMRRDNIESAISEIMGYEPMTYYMEHIFDSHVAPILRKMGYEDESTFCNFQDKSFGQAFFKELSIRQAEPLTDVLRLGDGATVVTPRLVLDEAEETIVLLEMLGPKQAVRANWAALVDNSNRVIWLKGTRITKTGMKNHVLLTSSLPCGWQDYALLHKQASLNEMNPEQPFYLLSEDSDETPPLFYPMLNKAMRIPILDTWEQYLWERGKEENLIQVAASYGIGFAAFRVIPNLEQWEAIVQAGMNDEVVNF